MSIIRLVHMELLPLVLIQKPKQTKDKDCQGGGGMKDLIIVFNNTKKVLAEGPSFAQESQFWK